MHWQVQNKRLRQGNFGSYSTDRIFLREGLRHDEARDILGVVCSVLEDKTKVWSVKMPQFIELEIGTPAPVVTSATHVE